MGKRIAWGAGLSLVLLVLGAWVGLKHFMSAAATDPAAGAKADGAASPPPILAAAPTDCLEHAAAEQVFAENYFPVDSAAGFGYGFGHGYGFGCMHAYGMEGGRRNRLKSLAADVASMGFRQLLVASVEAETALAVLYARASVLLCLHRWREWPGAALGPREQAALPAALREGEQHVQLPAGSQFKASPRARRPAAAAAPPHRPPPAPASLAASQLSMRYDFVMEPLRMSLGFF